MKRNSTELKVKYHKGDKPSKKFNNKNPRPGNMGQWANPGVPTEIPSGNITMQGVPYPVKGIDNFGNEQIMMPGADYVFPGSVVTEIPMVKSGGWLEKYQGTTGGSETGKRPAKYKVTASDIEASDINEQSQNYYNPDDFYYSDLEYDKDKDSIAERVNLCKTTGKGCLSTANYWYNKWVAPKIGNPSSWDELTHSGVNSTEENTYDSWDVHGLDNRVVLYDRNSYYTGERQPGHGKGKIREAEGIWKELDLPIGAIVGYGEHGVNFQKPGEVSLNKQKGLPESGHSGRVVAFDKDTGEPWVFDSVNGLSRISENGYQPISVISVDNRILGNTYSNMQKGKNAYTTANTTPIEIQWDDFIDEDGDVVSFDEDEFNPFMQSFINNKPKWQGILGLDDKTYNEYARIAGALAISETEGGNDNTWRYGLPSYTLDKMGLTDSTGITQLNNDVVRNLYQKHQDKFHRYGLFMSAEGRKQSGRTGGRLYNFSNPAPQDAAFVTMLLLKDNKANAERLFKKGKTNNPNLTEADKQWYTWNQQQTLLKGEAQGDAIMLKKFRDAYNKIRVTEGKQPKLAEKKTGGSKLPPHLPEAYKTGGWLENYGDLPVFQTDGEFVYNGKTYKRKVNQNNQVEYYFVQPGKSVMSPSEEVPIAPVQARELDSFYNSPARAMQEKGEMLGQGLKRNVQQFREKEQATKKTSMRQQAIDAANAQFAGTDATNVVQAVTPEEQQQVDAAQAERDRIERTGTIKAWDPLEEQKKMFGLRMGMPTAEAAYVGTTGTAPALWAPAAGGVYAAGAQGIVPALNWFNNTLVGQGLNVYLGAESAVNLPTHAKEFYDRPSLATGTQLLWDPIMMKFGYEGAKGLVGRGRNVYNALDAKWNKFMWGDESINVPASLPGSSNSGSSAGVISEAYQPGSTLRNTRMVGNEGYTEDIPQWKLDRMRLREEYERIQALAEPIEDAASGNWYRESVRSNLLERLSLAERPSKQKVLRAIKTDNLPNSNLKMIRSFRGNLETPKKIKIIGSSGDLSVNPVGDNTWTLSTRMTNPVEAGKAMNWLNKTFTRPNPSIVENNSLSLDSYKGWLNTATKSKDWTGTFSNYISLNNQHQHSNLFKGLDVSGNEAIIFNNMDDAAEAAKRVNSKLLEPKGISEKAFAVQKSNGQWGLLIPNYKLTRNWAKGGAFELTLSKNDNFTKSNKNWLDMYE